MIRPADANEVAEAWRVIMGLRHRPVALILSRQKLPTLDRVGYRAASGTARGAYVLADADDGRPDVLLLASGSEAALCLDGFERFAAEGIKAPVVSMPSWELFECQDDAYRDTVLPPTVRARVSVELASTLGWARYVGLDGTTMGCRIWRVRAARGLTAKVRFHGRPHHRSGTAAGRTRGLETSNHKDRGDEVTMRTSDTTPTERAERGSKLADLRRLGQSIWYDNIRRALLDSGELEELVEAGVVGVTSNPSIFEKAIAGSADYDQAIARFAEEVEPAAIYESLALEDIQRTADLLRPVYEKTRGLDGYVSLEVSPRLAHDTEGTIAEARRLFAALARPNVMIKVPATGAGIPAIEALIAAGINVNVTLIFAVSAYLAVVEAYLSGLERLKAAGGELDRVASVASFFVSRVDTAVDAELAGIDDSGLRGTISLANARVAYARFCEILAGHRWQALADVGARPQRLLWASTGTKDPSYSDTLYVDELIGPHTVNTVPPATLDLFLDHGTVGATLEASLDDARDRLTRLEELGIDLDAITSRLLAEGVAAFGKSFEALVGSVAEKRASLKAGSMRFRAALGSHEKIVKRAVEELRDAKVMRRIWAHDTTVWSTDPSEITDRLGWLHVPENMLESLSRIRRFVDAVQADGYIHAVLLGMGGSSLAPEGFARIFAPSEAGSGRFLELAIIDSTDPDMIAARSEGLDLARTLFIVATKSGGTVETLSAFKHFYNRVVAAVGNERAGDRFIAITDPGSKLVDMATEYGFRDTFLNDPHIGGRYSALSYFGLVPAALVGVDVERLLGRALTAACNAASCNCPVAGDNDAGRLGVILGELAKLGRDKLTITTSHAIASFGDWIEQLVAESTGKDGTGILPVVGEPIGPSSVYGSDRVFVDIRLAGDGSRDAALSDLREASHPVVTLELRDRYDLGGQFFLWEMATAVAGHRLGIHPFNQPDVEAAKVLARDMVAQYAATGELPAEETAPLTPQALRTFLEQAQDGDYVALQAYVPPTPETDRALARLRVGIRDRLELATTSAYGPRFLHSTGQLHKGDRGNGLFLQLTSDPVHDISIPDVAGAKASRMSFQVLKMAQALGDARALRDAGRRVIRFHLGSDVPGGLELLAKGVA